MTLLSYAVIASAAVLAANFIYLATRKTTLMRRLESLAPGAGLAVTLNMEKVSRSKKLSKAKATQIDFELPDLVELLASSILTGNSLHSSVARVCERASGLVATELTLMLRKLELGSYFDQELSALCQRLPHPGISEFANKLSLALARGTPLAGSLVALSQSLRKRQSNLILARAGANETKMLIPLVALVLPTTVIFATYPSVQFLSFGFN